MSKKSVQPQDKYVLRLPDGMRDRLKAAADSRLRSMNAEIIARLEGSFRGWPKITLNEDLFARVKGASLDKRKAMEKEIEEFTIRVVERELPASHELFKGLTDAFYTMLQQVPEDEREAFRESFKDLSYGMAKAANRKPQE